jgi:hypothetical protein
MVELREFVTALKDERDSLLDSYISPEPRTYVGRLLADAGLDDQQKRKVFAALDTALTDAFYTILYGLDGASALGPLEQQSFTIADENGRVVSDGSGNLEAAVSEIFRSEG